VSAQRLARLRESIGRLGPVVGGIAPVVADGRQPPFREVGLVLIDAPCTGTGTLRRHADGRWRLAPADIPALAALQTQLLDAAAAIVEPGGLLVYATCSLEHEENEEQVEAFLTTHTEFALEPGTTLDASVAAAAGGSPAAAPFVAGDGMLRVLPHEHGLDGAFAARLRRRS